MDIGHAGERYIVRFEPAVLQECLRTVASSSGATFGGTCVHVRHGASVVLVPDTTGRSGGVPRSHRVVSESPGPAERYTWGLRMARAMPSAPAHGLNNDFLTGSSAGGGHLEMLVVGGRRIWMAVWNRAGGCRGRAYLSGIGAWRFGDPEPLASGIPADLPRTQRAFLDRGAIAGWQGLSVAIVGAGRSGSLVADALASQGVRRFVFVDPEDIEPGNLDGMALVGTAASGIAKVRAVGESLVSRFPECAVTGLRAVFPCERSVRAVAAADVLITATDADPPRLAAGALARELCQIHLDIGTDATGRSSGGADIRLCHPQDQCLVCLGGVVSRTVNPGRRVPGSASRLLNASAAHLAADVLLRTVSDLTWKSQWIRLEVGRAAGEVLRAVRQSPPVIREVCPWCGERPTATVL